MTQDTNNVYSYIDIIENIEEKNNNKELGKYIVILRVKDYDFKIYYFTAGVVKASNETTAFFLSKEYCQKLLNFMTCEPAKILPVEKALKPIIITRKKQKRSITPITTLNIDGEEIIVPSKEFPGVKSREEVVLLEAVIKYPEIVKYL